MWKAEQIWGKWAKVKKVHTNTMWKIQVGNRKGWIGRLQGIAMDIALIIDWMESLITLTNKEDIENKCLWTLSNL